MRDGGMAIREKRALFRLSDHFILSYLGLDEQDINSAIKQLTYDSVPKNLFPSIENQQEPNDINVSMFGLAFHARESIPVDSHLSLSFRRTGWSNELRAVSKVAYCKRLGDQRRYKVGVKFKYMTKDDIAFLENYIVDRLQAGFKQHD